MKESSRVGLLKYLAFLAVGIFIYSLAVVTRGILFGDDGGISALVLYVLILAAGLLLTGFLQDESRVFYGRLMKIPAVSFLTFTLNIKEQRRFLASLFTYITLLVPVFESVLVYWQKGFFRASFEALVYLIPWFIFVKDRNYGFYTIMTSRRGGFGFIAMLAAIELAVTNRSVSYLQPWLLAGLYIYILLYLLIRNQQDIDENIFHKKHIEKSILPRNMRSFNVKSVIVLFLAIILLFNLKKLGAWLIYLIGRLTGYFIQFLVWLTSMLLPPSGSPLPSPSKKPLPGFGGITGTDIHPWWNFFGNILKYFIILYALYLLILFLARKLSGLVGWIRKLLGKMFSWGREENALETGDYDDITEFIKPLSERERKRAVRNMARRRVRDLKEISDPVERIRFIYASLLGCLGAYGIKTDISDTTLDILDKARVIEGIGKPFGEITDAYNGVRYGNLIPGQESLAGTEGNFREIAELLKAGH